MYVGIVPATGVACTQLKMMYRRDVCIYWFAFIIIIIIKIFILLLFVANDECVDSMLNSSNTVLLLKLFLIMHCILLLFAPLFTKMISLFAGFNASVNKHSMDPSFLPSSETVCLLGMATKKVTYLGS